MQIQELLKVYRTNHHFTQEQVAQKIMVTTQAVSRWENGQAMPSIDNLLLLSDLYDISIDELVQGSPHFKKPRMVGGQFTYRKGLMFLMIWNAISVLLTNFGYPPMRQVYWLVMIVGLLLVFPTIFSDYWIIEQEYLEIQLYSQNIFRKFGELLKERKDRLRVPYDDIDMLEIIYRKKNRFSAFDTNPDYFYLVVNYADGKSVELNFDNHTREFLPQFIAFLSRKQVKVIDSQNIIEALVRGESLSEHYNNKDE